MLVSVRYRAAGRTLEYARGYSRQGTVWSDLRLFTREQVLQLIEAGSRVATGRVAPLEGDFVVTGRVKLVADQASGALLAVDRVRSDQDNLGLPLF
ncbi:MAG: hypothetical protein ACRDHG_13410 [Anaerolineales bacterium]